jgi:hypothetical protein
MEADEQKTKINPPVSGYYLVNFCVTNRNEIKWSKNEYTG